MSFERLSLMIEYNQIGSLTSLGRRSIRDHDTIIRARSNSIRRGSYSIGMFKTSRGSASKVDLLKSAIEVNHSRNVNDSNSKVSNNFVYFINYSNHVTYINLYRFMTLRHQVHLS